MAHNIGQMFYFGKVPWHGKGQKLGKLADLETAMSAGGLNYTVSLAPLALHGEPESQVVQRMAVVRDDRKAGSAGRVLGVVHPNFKLLQNREGAELFDTLLGKDHAGYNTGGYLKNGEIVWLQAKLPTSMKVAADDTLETFVLFSNSHDGSYPIDIRFTTVRVVCNNTLNFAMRDKDKTRFFRRGHSGSLEMVKQAAGEFFNLIKTTQTEVELLMNRMSRVQCQRGAFEKFAATLLPKPAAPSTAATNTAAARAHETRVAKIEAARRDIMRVFSVGYREQHDSGKTHGPAAGNWWGALNAVTAWVDHLQDIEGDRFAHAFFGAGDELKSRAFELAARSAGVVGRV